MSDWEKAIDEQVENSKGQEVNVSYLGKMTRAERFVHDLTTYANECEVFAKKLKDFEEKWPGGSEPEFTVEQKAVIAFQLARIAKVAR